MIKYNMDFLIYRREKMETIKNMDPDELVDVLGVDSDLLMEKLCDEIDSFIEREYSNYIDMEEEDLLNDDTL